MMRALALLLLLTIAACDSSPIRIVRHDSPHFPPADRPVSGIVSSQFSDEDSRDRVNEARTVMDMAHIAPGMTVADIGAGTGYYTIRLSPRVGASGRVLAEDIIPGTRDRLADRVTRERLDNVSVRLGKPEDPRLPGDSFDRIFMIHMYHEIESPYEFLWNMRASLRQDGIVVVVDADRPTNRHGTPPALLTCEFRAVGYDRVSLKEMPGIGGYIALFRRTGAAPEPEDIRPCGQASANTPATP